MNRVQRIRQWMAEQGYEHTLEQMVPIIQRADELFDSVSYEEYMRYKALDEKAIRKMATACGETYKKAQEVVDIVLYTGKLKYEDEE